MRHRRALLAWFVSFAAVTSCRVASNPDAVRVACVGDSITYGAKIPNREDNCYPKVLGELLGDKHAVRNFGVNGATLLKEGDKPYWTQSALEDAEAFEPHIVIIMLGTNDTKPQNWKFKEQYAADFRALIARFSNLESKPRVFLCKPVPVVRDRSGVTEKTIKEEVIPMIESVANQENLPLIDLYAALQGRPVLFPDGVHPNAVGARIIARTVYEAIIESRARN